MTQAQHTPQKMRIPILGIIALSSLLILLVIGTYMLKKNTLKAEEVMLTGSVLETTPQGDEQPLTGAIATVMIDGTRYRTTTDSVGNFSLIVPSPSDHTAHLRVVVSYPKYEIVGKNIRIDTPRDNPKENLTFILDALNTDQSTKNELMEEWKQLVQDYQSLSEEVSVKLSDIEDDTTQAEVSNKLLAEDLEGIIEKINYETKFLIHDSIQFANNLLSASEFESSINRVKKIYQQIIPELE